MMWILARPEMNYFVIHCIVHKSSQDLQIFALYLFKCSNLSSFIWMWIEVFDHLLNLCLCWNGVLINVMQYFQKSVFKCLYYLWKQKLGCPFFLLNHLFKSRITSICWVHIFNKDLKTNYYQWCAKFEDFFWISFYLY